MKRIKDSQEFINSETGEVVSVISIIPEVRDRDFVKVFKLMSTKVIQDLRAGLNGATDTLWWFIDNLRLGTDEIYAHPRHIATELGMSHETVKKHLRKLKDFGYIIQKDSRQHTYKVNAELIFKGYLHKHKKRESEKLEKAHLKEIETFARSSEPDSEFKREIKP